MPSAKPSVQRLRAATLAAVALGWCASAEAQGRAEQWLPDEPPSGEPSLSVTSTQSAELRVDNENGRDDDDNFGLIVDRLNATAAVGGFTAFARVDAFGFIDPPGPSYVSQLRLERVGGTYQLGGVSVTLGDFYEQLGRGLTLSMRKLPEAGVDVSIFGGRIQWVGEKNAVLAFVGRANAANMDSVSLRVVDDRHDLLAGGSYEMTPGLGTRLGFYGLYNQPEESVLPDDFQDLTANAGAYVDVSALAPWASSYLEVAVQQRYLAGTPQVGSAAYLTTSLRLWDLGLNIEAMMLADFEQKGSRNTALGSRFDYNRPPTLERIDQEVINNRDVVGVRLRPEYWIAALDTLVYANLMLRANEWREDQRLVQVHAYAGVDFSYDGGSSRVATAVGYRHEQQMDQTEPVKTASLVDVDWVHSLGLGFSTHLTTQTQLRAFQGRHYFWGSSFIGVEKTGVGGLTFELGYDGTDPSPKVRNIFYAVIGQWEVSRRLTLRGTLGTQRGGIKCVAGVCREWPAFSGAQAVLVSRF